MLYQNWRAAVKHDGRLLQCKRAATMTSISRGFIKEGSGGVAAWFAGTVRLFLSFPEPGVETANQFYKSHIKTGAFPDLDYFFRELKVKW